MAHYTLVPAPPDQAQAVRQYLGKLFPGDKVRAFITHPGSAAAESHWFTVDCVEADVREGAEGATVESMAFLCRLDGGDNEVLTVAPEHISEVWFVRAK